MKTVKQLEKEHQERKKKNGPINARIRGAKCHQITLPITETQTVASKVFNPLIRKGVGALVKDEADE